MNPSPINLSIKSSAQDKLCFYFFVVAFGLTMYMYATLAVLAFTIQGIAFS